jgi:hypothetical protein
MGVSKVQWGKIISRRHGTQDSINLRGTFFSKDQIWPNLIESCKDLLHSCSQNVLL